MTLSGNDTLADYQAALRAVQYVNTTSDPNTATRTVSFQINDGPAQSNVAVRQITVSPVDSLAGIEAGPLAYTAGGPATPVTAAITASDLASTTLAGATIQISGNYRNGEDLLSFTNTPNISGAWDATTGTLTLSGSDTLADYQAALRSVTYSDSSLNPSSATRTVSFQVNDGLAESNVATRQITVTPVSYSPLLGGIEPGLLVYTEGSPAAAVTAAITAGYANHASLVGATVQISGNYQSGEDLLSFSNTANITGNWNAATGTLTLSGVNTLADYQAALRAVTYADTSLNPSTATRTVSLQVIDCQAASNVVTRQLTVDPAVTLGPAGLPADTVGVAYNQTLAAGGGTGPYSLAVTNIQNAVAGLVVPAGGSNSLGITGTPTAIGTETFTVTATDALGATISTNYSITVNAGHFARPGEPAGRYGRSGLQRDAHRQWRHGQRHAGGQQYPECDRRAGRARRRQQRAGHHGHAHGNRDRDLYGHGHRHAGGRDFGELQHHGQCGHLDRPREPAGRHGQRGLQSDAHGQRRHGQQDLGR